MTDLIMRLRKCAEELSRIADAMAKQMSDSPTIDAEEIKRRLGGDAGAVAEVLATFGVDAKVEKVCQGPTINKIELTLSPGCRYSSVTNIEENLQGALKRRSIRIEAPIPGSEAVGIEYDRPDSELVTYEETTVPEITRLDMLRCRPQVPVVIGKNVESHTVSFDLATMPHLLVGGASGCGKTMFIHDLINGLVSSRSPEEVRLILFDPKCVEFVAYANLPHLVMPVLNENSRMVYALNWAVAEMEKRLKTFASVRVRNIQDYNGREISPDEQFKDIPETLPYIVIVVDELSDLMLQCAAEVVPNISRLSAKARAAGIHLVLATQCSGDNVVTGSIKANIPGRIAFKTATPIDSRVILDESGAERLIGRGDCLYRDRYGILQRVQVPCISDDEIMANVKRAIAKYSATEYHLMAPRAIRHSDDVFETDDTDFDRDSLDELVEKAKDVIRRTKRASAAHFQRHLCWGYKRASKVVDELERRGIIGPARGPNSREVFMDKLW